MKHLVYEQNGEVKVVTGTVRELETIETGDTERWFSAYGLSAEQAVSNYITITGFVEWQATMEQTYGPDEDNWPEEE